MKKQHILDRADYYAKEAREAQESANKLGIVFGFADCVVERLERSAFEYEQEAALYYWIASLHPKARAEALKKAAMID